MVSERIEKVKRKESGGAKLFKIFKNFHKHLLDTYYILYNLIT